MPRAVRPPQPASSKICAARVKYLRRSAQGSLALAAHCGAYEPGERVGVLLPNLARPVCLYSG